MKVMKRNGMQVNFDANKIVVAISKANAEVEPVHRLNDAQIHAIAERIEKEAASLDRPIGIEEIQDKVETGIMEMRGYEVAQKYVRYRFTREIKRKSNTTDDNILSLINQENEEAKQENSNKNPVINSTQRDYMAGEVSKDLTRRLLLPEDVVRAHDEGLIHFHDADYFAQREHNCFGGLTTFITKEGVMRFDACKDGQKVTVMDRYGEWRPAEVHTYGIRAMQEVTLVNGDEKKVVHCTPDHRWYLRDESVTTTLQAGDVLFAAPGQVGDWVVQSITKMEGHYLAWCVEEPVTHSFMLSGGVVTGNCDLINLQDMLMNGTVISETMITRPHSFYTACNITTQIIAQVASNQYGGQSFTLSHLVPFVEVSRQKIRKEVIAEREATGEGMFEEIINTIVERRLREEIKSGIQTIQYQLITLMTCNGQAPFVTMFMYLDEVPEGRMRDDLAMVIEEVLKQRIKGVQDETGAWITPAFPKLIYVLDEDNIHDDSKYFYLTELAAKCTAKRMVPDYISAKVQRQLKGEVYTCMGCRSFLTVEDGIRNPDGSHKMYGRFNQGVVTINLVDVACSSHGDMDEFWRILDERLELCHRALRCRHERLKGTTSDVAPILWQNGALARLEKGEKIDKLLYGGYSTISLGYAGLYEMCLYMTGKSHTDPEAKPFALSVMRALNDACAKWRAAENIAYSVYGTPLESTTYKFAKCLQKRFGKIKDVTDHPYITNSYHVNVRENITAFDKLSFEADFQKLSPGGAISYVEVPNMQDNIPAVIAIMRHIYDTIVYAELNTKSDHCDVCGYDGEIQAADQGGQIKWICPKCGNSDERKLHVARRTCGYIGTQFWNYGRSCEIMDRVIHTSKEM